MRRKLLARLPFGIMIGLVLVAVSLLGLYPESNYWFPVGLTGFGFIFLGIGFLVVDMFKHGEEQQ